jgi:hypothetical protein
MDIYRDKESCPRVSLCVFVRRRPKRLGPYNEVLERAEDSCKMYFDLDRRTPCTPAETVAVHMLSPHWEPTCIECLRLTSYLLVLGRVSAHLVLRQPTT